MSEAPTWIPIAHYRRVAQAHNSALALAAKDIPYAIERDGEGWALRVSQENEGAARAEVEDFEAEQEEGAKPPTVKHELGAFQPASLFVASWLLGGCFYAQQRPGSIWLDRGDGNNFAILLHGEWWRAITALTLHADANHLLANLSTGLLFAAFLIPQFGVGATWLLILATGAAGNAINAWGYRSEAHNSIGASTAVFGALGLLTGAELWRRWLSPATRNRWQLVVPIGAGLGLLAYLGIGDKGGQTDYMAHLWGFVAGVPAGGLAAALGVRQKLPRWAQGVAATVAMLLPTYAWMRALG